MNWSVADAAPHRLAKAHAPDAACANRTADQQVSRDLPVFNARGVVRETSFSATPRRRGVPLGQPILRDKALALRCEVTVAWLSHSAELPWGLVTLSRDAAEASSS